MALENDIQLLDDYLAGRLTAQEKVAFEQRLRENPDLQHQMKFQQNLIQGIKQARIAELKAMLNNVPVSPVNVGTTSVATKIISAVTIVGVVSTALYFYFDDSQVTPAEETKKDVVHNEVKANDEPEQPEVTPDEVSDQPVVSRATEKSVAAETTPAEQPKLEIYTPETEADQKQLEKEKAQIEIISKAFVTSSIEVETGESSRKYNFHYMFKNNKLVLFGSFENNLYEILEFIAGDTRTVFLFYNDTYYLLDLDHTTPTELVPIKDKALLGKLRQYRGN